jgi:hypothetical protein
VELDPSTICSPAETSHRSGGRPPRLKIDATLVEASGVIANGYLRLDREEWIWAVEKRRAALGR